MKLPLYAGWLADHGAQEDNTSVGAQRKTKLTVDLIALLSRAIRVTRLYESAVRSLEISTTQRQTLN